MEFLTVFFATILADNLLLAGKGVRETALMGKKKYSWILALFFFAEALLLGGVAVIVHRYLKEFEVLKYLSLLIFAFVMVFSTFFFEILVNKAFKEEIRNELKDSFSLITINSALMAIAVSIFAAAPTVPSLTLLAVVFASPIAYLVFAYIFGALMERFEILSAPKGFKGLPLLLICLAGLTLSLSMLHF